MEGGRRSGGGDMVGGEIVGGIPQLFGFVLFLCECAYFISN